MSFKFSVPALSDGTPGVETRPAEVARWVESLANADTHDSANALYDALIRLNRTRIGDSERLALLEAYRPAVARITRLLERDYDESALPLRDRAREAVNLTRELLIECACGYKILLSENTQKRGAAVRQNMPLLLHRTINALADTLILCYRTYSPTPAGMWHEMHQIYHYAAYFRLEDETVPGLSGSSATSIGLVYKQALLLALADPYRLVTGDVSRVLALVERFHDRATIVPYSPDLSGPGLFLIQTDSDRPPKALGHSANAQIAPVDKLLSAAPLVDLLGQVQAGGLPDAGRLDLGPSDLVERLQKSWSSPPKRVFHRFAANSGVDICSGIRSLAHHLRRAEERAAAEAGDRNVPVPIDTARMAVAKTGSDLSRWEIANQSAGGIALKKSSDRPAPIAVGEVVGMRYQGQTMWGIGATRWLQNDDAGGMEIGIELLAPTASVVTLTSPQLAEHTVTALLLPELPALKKAASLLAPSGTFVAGREFVMDGGSEAMTVRAERLLLNTPGFDLFEYSEH
jgi:cyclic-di-GMP-binding protein